MRPDRNSMSGRFSDRWPVAKYSHRFLNRLFLVIVTMSGCWRTKDTGKRVRDNAESYRWMSARILESQDSERRRIARELHDRVGQYLAGLKINLNQLETGVQIDASNLIRETIELTDCAIQEVRTISHLLHPPLLEELGFLSAARCCLDEYGKRSEVKVSLLVEEPVERLPREVEIALFRVLRRRSPMCIVMRQGSPSMFGSCAVMGTLP